MATARRRCRRPRGNLLLEWHERLGDDSASGRHRRRRPPADSRLSLSGCSDIQEWWADEPIRSHRHDRSDDETKLSFCLRFHSSHTIFVLSPAPAPASLLSLSPSSAGGLLLKWSPPAGHWEGYRLFLFDGSQELVSTALDREAVSFSFPGTRLTPGKLHRAVLRVESGGLSAESSCEGSTGETDGRHRCASAAASV